MSNILPDLPLSVQDTNFIVFSFLDLKAVLGLQVISKAFRQSTNLYLDCRAYKHHFLREKLYPLFKRVDEFYKKWDIETRWGEEKAKFDFKANPNPNKAERTRAVLDFLLDEKSRKLVYYQESRINLRNANSGKFDHIFKSLRSFLPQFFKKKVAKISLEIEELVEIQMQIFDHNIEIIKCKEEILKLQKDRSKLNQIIIEIMATKRFYSGEWPNYQLLPYLEIDNTTPINESVETPVRSLYAYWEKVISAIKECSGCLFRGEIPSKKCGQKPFVFMKVKITYMSVNATKLIFKINALWLDKWYLENTNFTTHLPLNAFYKGLYMNAIPLIFPIKYKKNNGEKFRKIDINQSSLRSYLHSISKHKHNKSENEKLETDAPIFICEWIQQENFSKSEILDYSNMELIPLLVKSCFKSLMEKQGVELNLQEGGKVIIQLDELI